MPRDVPHGGLAHPQVDGGPSLADSDCALVAPQPKATVPHVMRVSARTARIGPPEQTSETRCIPPVYAVRTSVARSRAFRNIGPAERTPTRPVPTPETEGVQTRSGPDRLPSKVLMPGIGYDVPARVAVEEIHAVRLSVVPRNRKRMERFNLDAPDYVPCLPRRLRRGEARD